MHHRPCRPDQPPCRGGRVKLLPPHNGGCGDVRCHQGWVWRTLRREGIRISFRRLRRKRSTGTGRVRFSWAERTRISARLEEEFLKKIDGSVIPPHSQPVHGLALSAFCHIVACVFQPPAQFAGSRTRSVARDELEKLPLTGERRFAAISWHGRGWVGAVGSMAADRCPPQARRRRSERQVGDLEAGGLNLVHYHSVFAFRRDHGRTIRPNTSYSNNFF